MTSLTPSTYETIHLKVFFKTFAQNFSPNRKVASSRPVNYFKVFDKPTKGPVHLDLFLPSVIRGRPLLS